MNPPTSKPRLGMICPRWLPSFGGAQQYTYRMAEALIAQGFDVRVFAGTAAKDTEDNGDIPATRHTPRGNIVLKFWKDTPPGQDSAGLSQLFRHYTFMEAALEWATANAIDIAVIGHPFQVAELHHARELYTGLRSRGIKVGCLHFDLGSQVEDALRLVHMQGSGDWEEVADTVSGNLRTVLRDHDPLQAYYMMGSPLLFSPEFVISCSDWSGRFIDPDGRVPKLTLHPPLDAAYWREPPAEPPLERRNILMVNPQGRKGPVHMARLIETSAPGWTFRILQGAWGESLRTFIPQVEQLSAAVEGRIEVCGYVPDMRQAYAAAGMMFFLSFYDGYGMAAVEPMYSGVPVVSSNHPAVLEAVGDGALTCCPYRATPQDWHDAVDEVLTNTPRWRERSLARAAQLQERQDREIAALGDFFVAIR